MFVITNLIGFGLSEVEAPLTVSLIASIVRSVIASPSVMSACLSRGEITMGLQGVSSVGGGGIVWTPCDSCARVAMGEEAVSSVSRTAASSAPPTATSYETETQNKIFNTHHTHVLHLF